MSTRLLNDYQSDGALVSERSSEGSSASAGLVGPISAAGNPRLRRMSTLEVRRLLRKALIGDAATMAAWKAYDDDWRDRERTYATAHVRGFERGEKGGRI